MRRPATTLSALAALWAFGATLYLLLASTRTGVVATAMLAGAGGGRRPMAALSTPTGVWMAGLLLGVTLLSIIPLGVALGHPAGLRPTAWTVGGVLLGFCLLAGSGPGLLYLPSALLLAGAGTVARTWHTVPRADDAA